jgi:DNA repair exonuclease SbcCD nuclease subunit
MLVAILADMHMGYKRSSPLYWEYFSKFYDNIFIPNLKKLNIDTIIQLGDMFDDRKSLTLDTIYNAKQLFFDKLTDTTIYNITGNHDVFLKDSNHINSQSLVLQEYTNIKSYSECATIKLDGRLIDLIPWINKNNYQSTLEFINSSKSQIAMAHLEVNGASLMPGYQLTHGTDSSIFSAYTKILSGHIHFKSVYENIHYIGIPYELNQGDQGAVRGFTILNTETLKTKFIKNPYRLYHTIKYTKDFDYSTIDTYKDTIVKVIVESIDTNQDFDNFIDVLSHTASVVKISESNNKIINNNNFTDDTMHNSDTLELFQEYISGVSGLDNNDNIMKIITKLYSAII